MAASFSPPKRASAALATLAALGAEDRPIFEGWDYRKPLRSPAKKLELALTPTISSPQIWRDFGRAATDDGACESGHLSGLAYMADRTDKDTINRYIQPQIKDAPEVPDKGCQAFGTPNGGPSRREQ